MATWYNYLLTSVAGLSNLACLYYTRKKFNTQLAQFYLMCLDSGTSALCCLAMLGANLVNELMATGCSKLEAKRRAYQRLLPFYRRKFRKNFGQAIMDCRQLRKEPLYQAVMKSARKLKDEDDYDTSEAVATALLLRKAKLNEEFPEEYEESDENDDS